VDVTEDDAVVRVVARGAACSGVLVRGDVVLTAHHCVAGRDALGDPTPGTLPPAEVRVELGGDALPWDEVTVRAVVAPPCGHAAGIGDLALLVLDRAIPWAPVLEPRLDGPPREGEPVEILGFGRCALSERPVLREARPTGPVGRVARTRFALEAGICPGDSGGPAISRETGEVVGVVSAGVMDGRATTLGPAVLTRLDAWRPAFALALLVAQGATIAELPPLECSR
jgi:hypothetical protein